MSRSAHIFFHDTRAARAFNIHTARIKCDALTNNSEAWMGRITPFNFNEARRFMRGAPDRMNHWEFFNKQLWTYSDAKICVIFHG